MPHKTALITGITGQDGSYLAELLLAKGYAVHGLVRRSSISNTARIQHLLPPGRDTDGRLSLHHGDMTDTTALARLLEETAPDEIYNLAAQSHVAVSFESPDYTANVDGLGALRLLEAVRGAGLIGTCRFYQASTSELYGLVQETPQRETTPFHPRSPYAVAKLYAYWIVRNYREAHGLYACSGILFNHESPLRGRDFVTRKVTFGLARVALGQEEMVHIGNLEAKRDWGFAGDYVEAMWAMLQQDKPDDYVIATGEAYSVAEMVELAFAEVGLDWKKYVEFDPRYLRPTEVDFLQGDATKARTRLNWKPRMSFKELVKAMVAHDLDLARQERTLKQAGFNPPARGAASAS